MTDLKKLHSDWIGMARPEGLVLAASVLGDPSRAVPLPSAREPQEQLRELLSSSFRLTDLSRLLLEIFAWPERLTLFGNDLPDALIVTLDGGEVLRPHAALRTRNEPDRFLVLVSHTTEPGAPFDAARSHARWTASEHQRFERLLRETNQPVGLLSNGESLRFVYAPAGESTGWIDFRFRDLLQVDGRPLLAGLLLLLHRESLFASNADHQTHKLLQLSREAQNDVSVELQQQLLDALRELLRAFESADRFTEGRLLYDYREHRGELLQGLVTVLLRMVFVLYAEERGLLPMEQPLYRYAYSLTELHAELRKDRALFGDTLDEHFGNWGRLLALFRVLHDGAEIERTFEGSSSIALLTLPKREGRLFSPDAFPFLEGRNRGSVRSSELASEAMNAKLPRISDGSLFRVLDSLLMLRGERLLYKGLDVEQLGSVYEGLMGFDLRLAEGHSLALTSARIVVDLEALHQLKDNKRTEALKEQLGSSLSEKVLSAVKKAKTFDELHQALVASAPAKARELIPRGALFLQPGAERRRSGSHYTPRALTEPIVRTALRPVLARFGPHPSAAQLLSLKVCDPAMGSGAFLVEACRQLAQHLLEAWRREGFPHELSPDTDHDPLLRARRLVAQRCLYGVDKNPLAVELAKLSLWLVTFARDRPFTFVDHALQHGDSLAGLSREQVLFLDLESGKSKQAPMVKQLIDKALLEAQKHRAAIRASDDPERQDDLREHHRDAVEAVDKPRLLADLVLCAFFSADKASARKKALTTLQDEVTAYLSKETYAKVLRDRSRSLRSGEHPVPAFHWELEFPEVFEGENPGFDVFVGNPPFAGKNTLLEGHREGYLDLLKTLHEESHGNADLVAHFFRRVHTLLRNGGTFGLVATNTIAQGDTRSTGLRYLCNHGIELYEAKRRHKWPGLAAVVVSVIHGYRGKFNGERRLDDKVVPSITAFLFHSGGNNDPAALKANKGNCFIGSYILGMGFTFDDENEDASPLAVREKLIAYPHNAERIQPYLGGEELNDSPTHSHRRYVINFEERTEAEARAWPDLMAIVEAKVKPERERLGDNADAKRRREHWWLWGRYTSGLFRTIRERKLERVLVIARVSNTFAFTFVPANAVLNEKIVVFTSSSTGLLTVLQSRVHETWARFFSAQLKDDLQYTPSDCFETFPFPPQWESLESLEAIGREYYEFRANLMRDKPTRVRLGLLGKENEEPEGLTKTYNRFHDRDEHAEGIVQLRALHTKMDRAVLDAYGWADVKPQYDFRVQIDERERYTWDEETRDEVLARLLELNHKRAEEEASEQEKTEKEAKPKKPRAPTKKYAADAPFLPSVHAFPAPTKRAKPSNPGPADE